MYNREVRKVASYRNHTPRKLIVLFVALALALPLLTYAGFAKGAAGYLKLPSKENFHATQTVFYDRNGEKLYETSGGHQEIPVKLNQVPRSMVLATLAAEDADFYKHRGVDPEALARATYKTLTSNEASGGSTITQQLIKNTYLSSDKTVSRKLKEMTYAIILEQKYSKDQILERYLNQAYYGQQSYGVADAASTYFGKDLSQLTLGEASMLAGLPQSPTRYSPLGSNPQLSKNRQKYVLDRMVKLGYINKDQAAAAQAEQLAYAKHDQVLHAPHFVFYVKNELAKYYGDDEVDSGGLKVYTTLDLKKQEILEDEVRQGVASVARYNASNGAAVAMDPKTGEVLAMVGSADFNNDAIDGKVNVATSDRQPGSSFKPFVYLTALEQGMPANTILHDKPTTFYNTFKPENYDKRYRGNVTMRYALGSSLNVPAVELYDKVGAKPAIDLAHKLGITTLNDPDRYGLSLVLGGGEVKLLDMVAGYSVMANKGQTYGRATVTKVVAPGDKVLYERKPEAKQIVNEGNAFIITDILGDSKARVSGFGSSTPLELSRPAAAKTGTTNNYKDNWTVGYTPNLVVGVWVGNSNGEEMRGISGVQGAAPIWHDAMERLLQGMPVERFEPPKNVTRKCACVSGLGGGVLEYFLNGTTDKNQPQSVPTGEFESETEPPTVNGKAPYWYEDAQGKRHYYYR
jgi:1A family penicillin-binding protein